MIKDEHKIKWHRVGAFLMDMCLVYILALCLSNLAYLNPFTSKYEETSDEYAEVYTEYATSILATDSNTLDTEEANNFMNKEILPLFKKMEYYNMFYYLWYLLLYFLYFVVFVYFNNGQTVGKKLFKLKVVNKKTRKKATFSNLLVRSIFSGSSLFVGVNLFIIIRLLLNFITNVNIYYEAYLVLSALSFVYEVAFLIYFLHHDGKVGLDDLFGHTKVIEE